MPLRCQQKSQQVEISKGRFSTRFPLPSICSFKWVCVCEKSLPTPIFLQEVEPSPEGGSPCNGGGDPQVCAQVWREGQEPGAVTACNCSLWALPPIPLPAPTPELPCTPPSQPPSSSPSLTCLGSPLAEKLPRFAAASASGERGGGVPSPHRGPLRSPPPPSLAAASAAAVVNKSKRHFRDPAVPSPDRWNLVRCSPGSPTETRAPLRKVPDAVWRGVEEKSREWGAGDCAPRFRGAAPASLLSVVVGSSWVPLGLPGGGKCIVCVHGLGSKWNLQLQRQSIPKQRCLLFLPSPQPRFFTSFSSSYSQAQGLGCQKPSKPSWACCSTSRLRGRLPLTHTLLQPPPFPDSKRHLPTFLQGFA